MNVQLPPPLEVAMGEQARKLGVSPETLALKALTERFLPKPKFEPQDEWERAIFEAAVDCGFAPPDFAFTSEGLYD